MSDGDDSQQRCTELLEENGAYRDLCEARGQAIVALRSSAHSTDPVWRKDAAE